ncbi:MAG: YkgJ family cysteine cluster protein [Bacillota bacterium]|nr:YkgJ family cysteine cluster protein [Bacillota bacterium]
MDKTDQQKACLECRECCQYVEVPTTMLSMEVVEYWLTRGDQFYINPKSGAMCFRFYKPCQHLTETGCAIYENRPKICRDFMCAYKNKETKDGKERICAETMAYVAEVIKKWKETNNDLQPSEPVENAGIPGVGQPV